MSAARDALIDIDPDILCLQEIRDWDSAERLLQVLPGVRPVVASRFRDSFGGGLSRQQLVIAAKMDAESAWSEDFARDPDGSTPPRGFAFAAFRLPDRGYLLVYSVHLKANGRRPDDDMAKRDAAAAQLVRHAEEMERLYSAAGPVSVVVGGDFNTDPTDPRFAAEQTFATLGSRLQWAWWGIPPGKRVTIPAHEGYPDACFDGFFFRNAVAVYCRPITPAICPGIDAASDHRPVLLEIRP